MSIIYTCNLCGETIGNDEPFVTLNGNGDRSENAWKTGWIGHYHSRSPSDCWQAILDTVRATDGSERRLASIPTASADEIASRRDNFRRPPATPAVPAAGTGDLSATSHGVPLLTTDPFGDLSARTRDLLMRAGIDGTQGLRAILADGTLSEVPGIGPKRLEEIRAAVSWDAGLT